MGFKVGEGAGHLRDVIAHQWIARWYKVDARAGESGRHDVNCPRLHRLLPAGGFHIRQQRFLNTLFQHDGGQREAFHIQRRHQRGRAYQPVNARLQRGVGQLAGQDRHLSHRHAAEVVKPIAGVVFDDQQAARLAGHRLNGGKHRVDARRGEQIAADRGGQHAFTNKADVRRFMAGAAAGDHRHVVFIQIATDHHPDRRVALQTGEVIPRAGDNGTLNHIVDEAGALVKKELRHSGS